MRISPAIWLLLLAPACVFAQSMDTVLGGSQLMDSAGIQTKYQYRQTYGWTGVGYMNGGFQFGAYSNFPLHFGFAPGLETNRAKYRIGVGDQQLNATFTVDEYDFYKPTARGTSIFRHTRNTDIQGFFGSYSVQDAEPYLCANTRFSPNLMGALIGHFQLPREIELQSFNTFGDSLTSIQSFLWKPSAPWRLSTAGGIGSDHPYFANAVEYDKNRLDLRASYVAADKNFHRQDSTYDVEPLGFNAKAEIPLFRDTRVRFQHRHELITVPAYLAYKQNASIGTIDLANLSTGFLGFKLSASVNQSRSDTYQGKDNTVTGSISRNLLRRWRSTFSYLDSRMPSQKIEVLQEQNEYRVHPHLSISHTFDRMNGSISNTFGGKWSSNLVSFSIDNQVYTSPVAAQFGQKPVFQAWTFSIRLRTPHGTSTHLETTVDPFGKTQWGGYLTGLQYQRLNSYNESETHVAFSKYIVQGKVVNEAGGGVWGIAVQIGKEVVYSDSNGEFFVHVKNSRPVSLTVSSESSMQSAKWKLQSAPAIVHGVPEGNSVPLVLIVVQMPNQLAIK
jgi:hypothetical protein